ncbi:hypothetical protein BDF20DRAFT_877135, partial [Mycotypha africana]|uniref:uncharacterized protein n=1 Tax=Mycotypha africana TaxID=64632 RepID=UPI002301B192
MSKKKIIDKSYIRKKVSFYSKKLNTMIITIEVSVIFLDIRSYNLVSFKCRVI